MTVHFVSRSHYEGPMGLYHKRFDDESVLAWFQRHWQGAAGRAAWDLAEKVLGTQVYGFSSLFNSIAEHSLPKPRTNAQLAEILDEHLYVEVEILHDPHCLQVLTDDDEIQLAYYFFDDAYLKRHSRLAALLLHDGWQLPPAAGTRPLQPAAPSRSLKPKGKGEGTTYLVFHGLHDGENLEVCFPGPLRVEGVRLPDLARHLLNVTPKAGWPTELALLRSQLLPEPRRSKSRDVEAAFLDSIEATPKNPATWMAFHDWLIEHGRPGVGTTLLDQALRRSAQYPVMDLTEFEAKGVREAQQELKQFHGQNPRALKQTGAKALVQTAEHFAQACLHAAHWDRRDLYHQWFLFDDLWAGAHPELAECLLRFAARWDVLTPD